MSESCPSEKQLRHLIDGAIADAETIVLEQHLDRCSTCQQTVKRMTQDGTFWNSVAASLAKSSTGGPELNRVIDDLQQQSPEDAEQMGEAIELKMSSVDPPTEPGTIGRLKHYDILRVAGRGGMGIVVKAFDRSLRRMVAIKLLAPHLAGNGLARQRFIREGRAAAAITHQHVITIHAVEESPPFLVMQYVQGETLEGRIHRNGAMDVKDAIRVAMQIAQGLAAAHAQGVVHRDIKPANILLENGIARVRITDFGLARAIDDASLTQSGVIAGTPQYMAPEQASGDAIDERADLFSLGSVLYTMLAGHAPFRANTAMGVLKRLCDHAPRSIREINPDTPDWLMLIVNRLHAKRASDRFGSATEVAALLEKGLAAMQSGPAMQGPVRWPSKAPSKAVGANSTALEGHRTNPGVSSGQLHANASQAFTSTRTLSQKLLRPWVLFAVLSIVSLLLFVQAAALGAVLALLSLLIPALAPRLTARLFHNTQNVTTADASAEVAGVSQSPSIGHNFWKGLKKMPLLHRLIWTAVWVLPAIALLRFAPRISVYSSDVNRPYVVPAGLLVRYEYDVVVTLFMAFAGWLLIGLFFFQQRTSDDTRLFSKQTTRTGLLVAIGMAAMFCMSAYEFCLSNEQVTMAVQRNVHQIPQPSQAALQPQHQLTVEFEQPSPGMYAMIYGDNTPAFRCDAKSSMVQSRINGSGACRWRALVGDVEFASGEFDLADDFSPQTIQIPAARLSQLIEGAWMSRKAGDARIKGRAYPTPGGVTDADDAVFEFQNDLVITRSVNDQSAGRNDLQFEVDETTTPASITFTDNKGGKTHGIIRFQPVVSDAEMSVFPSAMYSGGMGMGYGGDSIDTLTICVSGTGTVRPWEFKADKQLGFVLYDLVRSSESSLIFEPLPADCTPTAIEESLRAWTKRLNVPRHQTNSLGIDMLLVPPATDVTEEHRMTALPEMNDGEYVYPGGKKVEYPFAISRDLISSQQFALFVKATNYVTDAERGLPLPEGDATQTTGGWTYHKSSADAAARCEWTADLNWKLAEDATVKIDDQAHGEESNPSRPVQVISHNDAVAYCDWLSK